MADCPKPLLSYATNGDLAYGVVAWANALELCNVDKRSLREWAK